MKCPFCGFINDKVVDSREAKEADSIRRRRECLKCGRRFTTYERIDEIPYMVIKKDGRRERRSEEHTSELQSRLHLVCRLLLEKKKKRQHLRDRSQSTTQTSRDTCTTQMPHCL